MFKILLKQADDAYREHARQYVSELRELPNSIKKTAEALADARKARASEVRVAKHEDWERRRGENIRLRAESARALRDEVIRSKQRRSTIPPEMEAEMRRLGIGPFAASAVAEKELDAEPAEADDAAAARQREKTEVGAVDASYEA